MGSTRVLGWRAGQVSFLRTVWLALATASTLAWLASIPAYVRLTGVITEQERLAADLIGAPALLSAWPQFEFWNDLAYHLLSSGASALSLGLATLIFRRRSHEPIALTVSITLLLYGVVMAGPLEMLLGQSQAGQSIAYFAQGLLWGFVLFMFYVFPDGRFVPAWTRWLSLLLVPWSVGLSVAQFYLAPGTDLTLFVGLYTVVSLTAPYAQMVRFRRTADTVQRQQIKWVTFGLTAWVLSGTVVSGMLAALARQWGGAGQAVHGWVPAGLVFAGRLVWPFSLTLLPGALAIALLRYRLWNIDGLIRRTLVYSSLTAIVVAVYVLAVGGLSSLFRANSSYLLSLLATGLIAVLFQPLRDRLQRAVNRLMYGERDDPYAVLSGLGQRLEATLAPEAVLPVLAETIAQTLKLPYVAVALRTAGANESQPAAVYGLPVPGVISLPLSYHSEQVGELRVGPRGAGEAFTPAEQRLLNDLARQAGVAAHTVRLTADLQHSRERLVSAREEERRRLRRDLHDGLGPTLASQTLTLTAARQLVRADAEQAEALLSAAILHAQDAVTDIRRLVHDLRPPALDDLGLVGAIRALTPDYSASGIEFYLTLPEKPRSLPAAVEVACYRIAQEAITNVLKHARASHCRLTLTIETTLTLEIVDNGRGLPAERHAGVGLTSLRERTSELGGDCRVEAAPGGGTRVWAALPLG